MGDKRKRSSENSPIESQRQSLSVSLVNFSGYKQLNSTSEAKNKH